MSAKKLLKAFYFSSEERKNYVETRLDNLAKIHNHSTSYIIEDLILKGLLPDNEEAKFLLMNKLLGNKGVRNTLKDIFSNNASGELGYAKYNNLRSIIDFAIEHSIIELFEEEHNYPTEYFLIQFEEIVKRIRNFSDYCFDLDEKGRYKSFVNEACCLFEAAKKTETSVDICRHLILVRDCWDILYDWNITYKYLAELVNISETGWSEDIETKEELHRLISEISKEWDKPSTYKIDFSKSDRTIPALLKFRCEESDDFQNGKNIYANDVPLGIVYSVFSTREDLIWDAFENKQAIKFALKKPENFLGVIENLRQYKEANGYKRVIITSYNQGIASFFTEESLAKCGFKKSEEFGSSLYFLQ